MTEVLKRILKSHGLDVSDESFAAIMSQIYYNWCKEDLQNLMNDILIAEQLGEEVFSD